MAVRMTRIKKVMKTIEGHAIAMDRVCRATVNRERESM